MSSSITIIAEIIGDAPYGIIKLSRKLNSTIAYRVPRSLLNEFSNIKEAKFYGTYILFNKVTRQAYVGRSEDLQNRIKQHHSSKDFWTEVFFVTSKGNELSLADIAYLEYTFYTMATDAKSYEIKNSTVPSDGNPFEQLNSVLDFTKQCLNLLGYDLFDKAADLTTYTSDTKPTQKKKKSDKQTITKHTIEITEKQYAELSSKNWREMHAQVKSMLSQCNIAFSDCFTVAAFHEEGGNNTFWADANTDFVNQKWTIVLHDKSAKTFEVVQVEPHTFSIDPNSEKSLKVRFKKQSNSEVISLKIMRTFIEKQSQADFKPYITGSISYSIKK